VTLSEAGSDARSSLRTRFIRLCRMKRLGVLRTVSWNPSSSTRLLTLHAVARSETLIGALAASQISIARRTRE
jgi:hypothetical protein